MPQPGDVAQPAYKRGTSLPKGEAQSANELIAQMGPQPDPTDQTYQPSGPAEQFLFGQTDRPTEPITAGAPFGAGPSVSGASFPSETQMVATVAAQVAASPNVSKETRAWAARVQAGE